MTVTLFERAAGQGTEGEIEAELESGTPGAWASLPVLPALTVRWEGGLNA